MCTHLLYIKTKEGSVSAVSTGDVIVKCEFVRTYISLTLIWLQRNNNDDDDEDDDDDDDEEEEEEEENENEYDDDYVDDVYDL